MPVPKRPHETILRKIFLGSIPAPKKKRQKKKKRKEKF
jgi:hypothetical protein